MSVLSIESIFLNYHNINKRVRNGKIEVQNYSNIPI